MVKLIGIFGNLRRGSYNSAGRESIAIFVKGFVDDVRGKA